MRGGWSMTVAGGVLGSVVWCVLAFVVWSGGAPLGPLELLFLAAPLVIVPLGFRLAAPGRVCSASRPFCSPRRPFCS